MICQCLLSVDKANPITWIFCHVTLSFVDTPTFLEGVYAHFLEKWGFEGKITLVSLFVHLIYYINLLSLCKVYLNLMPIILEINTLIIKNLLLPNTSIIIMIFLYFSLSFHRINCYSGLRDFIEKGYG